jgi:rare lipoprotein A
MRSRLDYLAVAAALIAVGALAVPARGAVASASAYSTADSPGVEGCTGRHLSDRTLTFASLIVPCGARVRICVGRRCVVATRTDSGPYVAGRSFDLAFGTIRALGFSSPRAFGVRTITWTRLR